MDKRGWSNTLGLIFCTLLIQTSGTEFQTDTARIQIFSGLHWTIRNDIIPYEATIPFLVQAHYTVYTPEIEINYNQNYCKANKIEDFDLCTAQEDLSSLEKIILKQVNLSTILQNTKYTTSRNRRGLTFLGDFFKWCCDIATQNQMSGLYQNQETIKDHTNNLINSVDEDHRDLIRTATHFNNFTGEISNLTKKLKGTFISLNSKINNVNMNQELKLTNEILQITHLTWTYILMNYIKDDISDVLEKCTHNMLSQRLIGKDDLHSQLQKLNKQAMEKNLTLAIDLHDIDLYYTLKLTHCKITNGTILATVNLPMRNSLLNYKVFETIQTPLLWKNKICTLKYSNQYIVKTDKYFKIVSSIAQNCNEHSYPLCLLPRQTINSLSDQNCLTKILQGNTIDELAKSCTYECEERPEHPLITKLLPSKYILTNQKANTQLKCNGSTEQVPTLTVGTLILKVPCECELIWESEVLITKLYPCHNDALQDYHDTKC